MTAPAPQRHGYALIVVLFCVILCSIMILTLMDRSTVSLKAASSFSHGMQVRALSDTVQSLVQAQIFDATTLNQTTTTPLHQRDHWASQPGALRVYEPDGTLRRIFKLYSSPTLQTDNPDFSGDIPATWHTQPSLYTDLNAPVRKSGVSHYPILNPNILDPTLLPDATGLRAGFALTNAPVATDHDEPNLAPMPVRWIYLLQDGTLCQLGDSRINASSNPIIGRIAFWTDDETAKVNLNTASPATQNSFWDTPRVYAPSEFNPYGWGQPDQNEFHRYPGHPATVSLRPILGNLGNLSISEYYKISPYYRWGGSEDGAVSYAASRTPLLVQKQDRPYASLDEILFRSQPDGNPAALQRTVPTVQQVASLDFFLSTTSRAPELNLAGQPRVSIWPIYGNPDSPDPGPTRRTPYDNLIAHCSTIGGREYYFTREQPLSTTHDFTEIPRNQALYQYLQQQSGGVTSSPSTRPSFLSKYGVDERDQILTEIFDYIRTTNLNEVYNGRAAGFQSYTPDSLVMTDGHGYGPTSTSKGAGFVVPIRINDTQGGGRFPAIQGVGIWFIQHLSNVHAAPETPVFPQISAAIVIKTVSPAHGYMPWIASNLQIEIANTYGTRLDVGHTFLDSALVAEEKTVLFRDRISPDLYHSPFSDYRSGNSPGGYDGSSWTMGMSTQEKVGHYGRAKPQISDPLTLPSTATHFYFAGGGFDIRLKVNGTTIQTYRADFPDIGPMLLPKLNSLEIGGGGPGPRHPVTAPNVYYWWFSRLGTQIGPYPTDVVRSIELDHGDARLALMTPTAESRPYRDYIHHVGYTSKIENMAHSLTGTHDWPYLWEGGSRGSYIPGIPYFEDDYVAFGRTLRRHYGPDIRPGITNIVNASKGWHGDFDNGVSLRPDGPFINKPDEGMRGLHATEVPYLRARWALPDGFFSPLRQVPSAAMFGSLPTGVKSDIAWRTLLFNPNPLDPNHFGFTAPADHYLLDLFRMPVVEPHAISGPNSTDGKINMNYAIAPFSYIKRASSWYALLETFKIFAIQDSQSQNYRRTSNAVGNYRYPLDITETLTQFETRFAANDLFRSATEICRLFLVPQGETVSSVSNRGAGGYWSTRRLTGDNTRERPYANLYPLITTQSDTYRIHLRVQILPPSGGLPAGKSDFEPLADYRGSRLIERHLDPTDSRLGTKAAPGSVNPDTDCLHELYQFRTLETRQFMP